MTLYLQVRVIPVQLQRLFAQLLLKNCQSVSTKDLTNSFGWTNDEVSVYLSHLYAVYIEYCLSVSFSIYFLKELHSRFD